MWVRNVLLLGGSIEEQDAAWEALSPAEQACGRVHPTESRRRQFALGRLCARIAILKMTGLASSRNVEVLAGSRGEPMVRLDGAEMGVRVTLAHSGSLAGAFAWPSGEGEFYSAGIDIERVRPTDIAQSHYAFSRRERSLLGRLDPDASTRGIAGWAVKEAAWKALAPDPGVGPEALEITQLEPAQGCATVRVTRGFRKLLGDPVIVEWVQVIDGPDGEHVLALAESRPREQGARRQANTRSRGPMVPRWTE